MSNNVKLIECITTWQGEGPGSGQYMLLVRFKKCQLKCSYCDTMIKMRNSVDGIFKISDLQKAINRIKGGLLITGGEPTMYNEDVVNMLTMLTYNTANVETNGYKYHSGNNGNSFFLHGGYYGEKNIFPRDFITCIKSISCSS